MYDAEKLYPEGYHPWLPDFTMDVSRLAPFISRTAAGGVKYYIVDFGISSYFEGEEERSAGQQVLGTEAAAHDCRPVSSRIPHCVETSGRAHREA